MTIKEYCKNHLCNRSECLFMKVCPFYMYGDKSPEDMTHEEVEELTKDIINLGKELEGDIHD